MNANEATGIRELTATELEYVSGGLTSDLTFAEWLENFALTFKTLTIPGVDVP